MTFTFCTSGAMTQKAGQNVNSAIILSGAFLQVISDETESFINNYTRINYTDKYATLNVDTKYILQELASNIGAQYLIMYDMSNYSSRYEAELMLDFLRDRVQADLKILEDKKTTDFLTGA